MAFCLLNIGSVRTNSLRFLVALFACFGVACCDSASGEVILWNVGSTTYSDVFGATTLTNGIMNVVAVSPAVFSNIGLREDGAVIETGYYGVRIHPGLSNVVAIAS